MSSSFRNALQDAVNAIHNAALQNALQAIVGPGTEEVCAVYDFLCSTPADGVTLPPSRPTTYCMHLWFGNAYGMYVAVPSGSYETALLRNPSGNHFSDFDEWDKGFEVFYNDSFGYWNVREFETVADVVDEVKRLQQLLAVLPATSTPF